MSSHWTDLVWPWGVVGCAALALLLVFARSALATARDRIEARQPTVDVDKRLEVWFPDEQDADAAVSDLGEPHWLDVLRTRQRVQPVVVVEDAERVLPGLASDRALVAANMLRSSSS